MRPRSRGSQCQGWPTVGAVVALQRKVQSSGWCGGGAPWSRCRSRDVVKVDPDIERGTACSAMVGGAQVPRLACERRHPHGGSSRQSSPRWNLRLSSWSRARRGWWRGEPPRRDRAQRQRQPTKRGAATDGEQGEKVELWRWLHGEEEREGTRCDGCWL